MKTVNSTASFSLRDAEPDGHKSDSLMPWQIAEANRCRTISQRREAVRSAGNAKAMFTIRDAVERAENL